MRGLDTNVLLRYLANDDVQQSQIARDLLLTAEADKKRFFISTVVLCEVIWTLAARYRLDRPSLVSVVEEILSSALFEVQDRDLVRRALSDFRQGRADFSDYLNGWQSWRAGCEHTVTFDKKLKGEEGFVVLQAHGQP